MGDIHTMDMLKSWRRANGLSQERLAARLNVSQAAVSRWEAGLDIPSLEMAGRIRSLVDPAARQAVAREELFVREHGGLRLLFDLDGATLLAASQGYKRLFPRFSQQIGRRFADRFVGETRVIYEDAAINSALKLGEIAMMTGTTERHLNVPGEAALRHHWTICFRKLDHRIVGEVTFELCAADAPTQLRDILRVDAI